MIIKRLWQKYQWELDICRVPVTDYLLVIRRKALYGRDQVVPLPTLINLVDTSSGKTSYDEPPQVYSLKDKVTFSCQKIDPVSTQV